MRARACVFSVGDAVYVKNRNRGRRWLAGKIERVTGPVSYDVTLEDGRVLHCHQDQIRQRVAVPDIPPLVEESPVAGSPDSVIPLSEEEPAEPTAPVVNPPEQTPSDADVSTPDRQSEADTTPQPPVSESLGPTVHAYPLRNHKP